MNNLVILTILFVTCSGCTQAEEISDITPEDLKQIEQTIFRRLVTPEDGQIQRDIKSLFAQYILASAMNAANSSESTPASSLLQVAAPQVNTNAPVAVAAPQSPQVIYIYVTQPTEAPYRMDNSKIKTKKPKPPKPTKKPKPPKAPHPDLHVESQAQQQQSFQVQQPQPQIIQQQQQQPNFPSVDSPQQSIAQQPQADIVPTVGVPVPTAVPILVPSPDAVTAAAASTPSTTLRPRPSTDHVLSQVDKILNNVAKGNITGIVDQSLQINSRPGVQNLVTGILNTIFCTPINRLLGRCRG